MYPSEWLFFFFLFFYSSSLQFIPANILLFSPCSNAEQYMNAFDQAMNALDERFSFLSSSKQIVSDMNDEKKVRA
jgi:ABC-type multidrug transport system fused ATPase/permease subunit